MKQNLLIADVGLGENATDKPASPDLNVAPRLRVPERMQVRMMTMSLDELLPLDHEARMVWKLVERWDLSKFLENVKARGGEPGRKATDPRLLLALWLYAYVRGIGNGRELARLCEKHHDYLWLCGGVSMNYHTLNDFRVAHAVALDELLTAMVAVLTQSGLVQVERIAQDGTRVRASAGSSSFRRRETLEQHLAEAREHIRQVQQAALDPQLSAVQRAAQERVAKEREEGLELALQELALIEQAKAKQKDKPSKHRPSRASTTDPEARSMRMADGGTRPAYNVQLAVDPQSQAIVGVDVVNTGSDAGQSEPMRRQVEQRASGKVQEHLQDGGFLVLEEMDRAAADEVSVYVPVPKAKKPGQDPHAPRKTDSPAVGAWRQRMATDDAKEIYKQRAASVERSNADLKTYRGLKPFSVRGLYKVRCIALLSVLAYNIKLFGRAMLA